MRPIAALLLFLCAFNRLLAQEQPKQLSLFGCSAEAVEVDVDRDPPLRFTLLSKAPDNLGYGDEKHKFILRGAGPFLYVNIYLSATLPESEVGRSSTAKLQIYAQTAVSSDENQSRKVQWWKLEPTREVSPAPLGKSSASLRFDATRIGGCFEQGGNCSFAEVALATPDPDLALLAIKFGENLGGANAENWTEASLLLDFRFSPPRVLATADCGYNEGGGACTAQDSAEMPRSELRCDWASGSEDFLCSEISSPDGQDHRDFYLLSDKPGPPRGDEVASLQDAVSRFRSKGIEIPMIMQGIGPVSWIDEVRTSNGRKLIVLGSPGMFHFIPETDVGLGLPVHVIPHPLIEGPPPFSNPSVKIDNSGWTVGQKVAFHSRQIYGEKDLLVLQVVAEPRPNSRGLYWLGISNQEAGDAYDAIELVGGAHYGSCGESITPENVVAIGKIAKPFAAQVQIEPATRSSANEESPVGWASGGDRPEVSECIRPGQITWKNGKLAGTMDDRECASAGEPKYIRVDETGKITLNDKPGN